MITKGALVPGFTLAFGEERIASVDNVRYLGVRLDQKMTFSPHMDHLKNSSGTLFSRLRGTIGAGWGIKRQNIMILYRGVFLPKITYGAQFWVHKINSLQAIKKLGTIQRRALLGMTSAYNTTSTVALQVIVGVPPLDIEIKWMVHKAEIALLPAQLRRETWDTTGESLLDEWQNRWEDSSKGRWTFKFFPNVRHRLRLPLALGHEVVQFMSGHGNFRAKLAGFNLQPDPTCACGMGDEYADHVLFSCPLHVEHRAFLELAVYRAGHLWPCEPSILISTAKLYSAFVRFSKIGAYMERP